MYTKGLISVATLLLPAFAFQEPCIEGCCGLLMKLSKASLELHTDVQSPIGAPARKPAVQLPLGNSFIKCCPCDEGQRDNIETRNGSAVVIDNAQPMNGASGPVIAVATSTSLGMAGSQSAPTTVDAAAPSINSENIHTFKHLVDTSLIAPCTREDGSLCPCGTAGCFGPARVVAFHTATSAPDAAVPSANGGNSHTLIPPCTRDDGSLCPCGEPGCFGPGRMVAPHPATTSPDAAPSVNSNNIHSHVIPIDQNLIAACTRSDGSLCPCGTADCFPMGPLGILVAMPTRAAGSDQEQGQQTLAANPAFATASTGSNFPSRHGKEEL